ncbi:AMFR (predicted) [Pycnogonum litorale]
MAYCCLLLFGKIIQKIVFGDLRVSEQQHIKDKFWNFVFYKFIFIFGVLNVRFMFEMLMWCGWFSVLGFLHIFAQLCKDRCDYVCFSPATPKWTHIKLMSLLLSIFLVATSLLILCIFVGFTTSFSTFAFMSAECLLLMIRALYVITR